MKNIMINDKDTFEQWLVGFTDGDGTFCISNQNGKWSLIYKLTASRYNLRILYFVKKNLGYGTVTKDNNNGQFIIRDRNIIKSIIIPIFDKYKLLTTKEFNYIRLKEALYILNDTNLSKSEIDNKLNQLKNLEIPANYVSTSWIDITEPLDANKASSVINKAWLIGFTEAEGSFYLVNKDKNRIVHGFGITQKLDKIVLDSIRCILHIPTKVRYKDLHNYYILDTTNSRAISNIILYFNKTMKGMKSVEYRIWSRSIRYKGNYEKLYNIRDIMRNLRKKLQKIKK